MRYIKKSETEPRDLREYKKNCRKASPPLKITYKDTLFVDAIDKILQYGVTIEQETFLE